VRAFLAANSRAVLATYWKVSAEEESDALFRTFYSAGRTSTIRGALKAAQNSLINAPRYSHPFYWGAYFVVGDASKSMLTRS
jgi:CHAT domain-containing protein